MAVTDWGAAAAMVLNDYAEATAPPGFKAGELPQPRHAVAATPDPVFVHGPP